jgi:hypothetical protein
MRPARRSAWVAAAATLAALTWQVATVHFNYRGNWTALFCIGEKSPMPAELESGSWIFPASNGYDGQYYRIVAHDPWMQTGLPQFVDGRLRYQRILLPAAAWLLAFGQPGWIDRSYILLVLLSVFAGTWFTAMWAAIQNRAVWWGIGFLFLPGVLITLNRMTVDITEYAFMAAVLYFWRRGFWLGCWIAGASAFLTRDLGLILIAALVGMCLLQRSWRRAAMFATAALPAVLWILYVNHALVSHSITQSESIALIPTWVFNSPLIGPFLAMIHPQNYPLGVWMKTATQLLDDISIAGVTLSACVAAAEVRRRPFTLESFLCVLYAALFVMASSRGFWADPYSYPRAFSPLVGLIAWRSVTGSRAWPSIPWLCLLSRVGWQLGPQAISIIRAVVE